MSVGFNIRRIRMEKEISLNELSRRSGISNATLSRYESEIVKGIPIATIEKIAKALCVAPEMLMDWKEETKVQNVVSSHLYRIPVFESVSAGFGAYADNCILDYEPVYIDNPSDVSSTICIKVSGDSMMPLINDGDLIVVRRQTSVDSGDIAVVMIDEEDALVKRVVYTRNTIELRSENPRYAPRLFEDEKMLRVRVLGKVLSAVRKF